MRTNLTVLIALNTIKYNRSGFSALTSAELSPKFENNTIF